MDWATTLVKVKDVTTRGEFGTRISLLGVQIIDFVVELVQRLQTVIQYTTIPRDIRWVSINPRHIRFWPLPLIHSRSQDIVDAKYNFTTQDMIQSSLTSWLNHGFNYTAPVDNSISTVLDMSINQILSGALWTMDGTFTLPVCHWSSTESVKAFFYNLNSPTNGGTGAPAR